jgi:hypothetical protein
LAGTFSNRKYVDNQPTAIQLAILGNSLTNPSHRTMSAIESNANGLSNEATINEAPVEPAAAT